MAIEKGVGNNYHSKQPTVFATADLGNKVKKEEVVPGFSVWAGCFHSGV